MVAREGNRELLAKSPSGVYESRSVIDGVKRIFAYRRLDRYPLVQIVGLPTRMALSNWQTQTMRQAIGLGLFVAVVLILGSRLAGEIEMRRRAEIAAVTLAGTDPLTALANRRRFNEVLAREWRRASRSGEPFACLMIDVDHFKTYNDTYGHVGGDHVLQAIAGVIAHHIGRPGDLGARYGGEEFAVLLPATTLGDAFAIAESIRAAVYTLGIAHDQGSGGVLSVSVGVASVAPTVDGSGEALVESADAALYRAKSTGRNRTERSESGQRNGAMQLLRSGPRSR